MSLASIEVLKDRAYLLAKARDFFSQRKILEVDTPALSRFAPIALNIDVIEASVSDSEQGYLHTSPEYLMKRLLAKGSGDIYFLGHVFRKGEIGRLHNPEFTMAEWYRVGFSFSQLIQETCEFLFLFFGPLPIRILPYAEAFSSYLGILPSKTPIEQLRTLAQPYLPPDTSSWKKSDYIQLLLTHAIEPQLGSAELTVLTDYPPEEAALACTAIRNGEEVAERFEIYYKGVELTNGYHELSNAEELRRRFLEDNRQRIFLKKPAYALDEAFLTSQNTLPDCCGVSVGFDRALLLRHNKSFLSEVIPCHWESTH